LRHPELLNRTQGEVCHPAGRLRRPDEGIERVTEARDVGCPECVGHAHHVEGCASRNELLLDPQPERFR
jgi:hypothetical protein